MKGLRRMANLAFNLGLQTERKYNNAAVTVLDSHEQGVSIMVYSDCNDPEQAAWVRLSEEEALWLQSNLGSALASAQRGDEYENTINAHPEA
jgi:hypothetical protein